MNKKYKKILIVYGSPHENGSTAALVDAFIGALPDECTVTRFDCFKRFARPCVDCKICHMAQMCAFDDLEDYYEQLESADAIVFAAPVYNSSFPAPMKAVLDRGQRYWAQRFVLGEGFGGGTKRPAVLLTAAGSCRGGGECMEMQLRPALTVIGAELVRCVHYEGTDIAVPIEEAAALAADAGRELMKL